MNEIESQFLLLIERIGMYPALLLTYVLFFFFERGWIIERGRVIEALLLLIALIVVASCATLRGIKLNEDNINEVQSTLEELNECM